jgi:hypothetical protein
VAATPLPKKPGGNWFAKLPTAGKAGVIVGGLAGAVLLYKRFKSASSGTTASPTTTGGGCPSGYMDDGTGTGNCIPIATGAGNQGGGYGGGGGGDNGLGQQILSALQNLQGTITSSPTSTPSQPASPASPFGGIQTGPNGTAWYGGPATAGAPYGTDVNGTPLSGPNYSAAPSNPITPGNGGGSPPQTSAGTGTQAINAAAILAAQPKAATETPAQRHAQEVANRGLRQQLKSGS